MIGRVMKLVIPNKSSFRGYYLCSSLNGKIVINIFIIILMDTGTPIKSKHLHTLKVEGGVKAIGPYSIGKIVNNRANIIYLSGVIGVDPLVKFNQESDLKIGL